MDVFRRPVISSLRNFFKTIGGKKGLKWEGTSQEYSRIFSSDILGSDVKTLLAAIPDDGTLVDEVVFEFFP